MEEVDTVDDLVPSDFVVDQILPSRWTPLSFHGSNASTGNGLVQSTPRERRMAMRL